MQILRNPEDRYHIALFGIDTENIPEEILNKLTQNKEWSEYTITRTNRPKEQSILYGEHYLQPRLHRVALGERQGRGICELIVEHKRPDDQVLC